MTGKYKVSIEVWAGNQIDAAEVVVRDVDNAFSADWDTLEVEQTW